MHAYLQENYIVIDSKIKDVGHLLQQAYTKVLALVGMTGIGKVNMVSLCKAFGVCFVLYSCIDNGVLKLNKCLQVVRLCVLLVLSMTRTLLCQYCTGEVTHCSYPVYSYNLSLLQRKAFAFEVSSTSIARPNKVLVYWASISMENSIDCRNGDF